MDPKNVFLSIRKKLINIKLEPFLADLGSLRSRRQAICLCSQNFSPFQIPSCLTQGWALRHAGAFPFCPMTMELIAAATAVPTALQTRKAEPHLQCT